ncbi:hypothetical protein D9M71_764690 [compost metagenome]
MLLTVFDDQVGLHFQVSRGVALSRAQAALIELPGHGLANALFSQVALDPRIIRAVLQRRLLPHPAAVAGKVAAGIEVLGRVVA